MVDKSISVLSFRRKFRFRDLHIRADPSRQMKGWIAFDPAFTKGDFQDPLTEVELEDKFRRYAGCAVPAAQVDAILQTTRKIEEIEHIEALIQLMRKK